MTDQVDAFRVSFKMESIPPQDVERMASEVLAAALEQLANLVEQS